MMKKFLLLGLVAFALSACASGVKPMYYWGNYSGTAYKLKKDQNEEALTAHVAELDKIIAESAKLELRVPPGVYAERGFYAVRMGDAGTASRFYNLEKTTYPESSVFMDRLMKNLGK